MSSADRSDLLRHVDQLRASLASPLMQSRIAPIENVGSTGDEAISAQFGSFSDDSPSADASDGPSSVVDIRWDTAATVADESSAVREAAHALVSSLGFCRLYGITLPPDVKRRLGGELPPEVLVPAIVALIHLLQRTTEDARDLPERFDAAEPLEECSHCTSLIELLMELWASFVVIDEEYQHYICVRQSIESPFGIWMTRILDAFAMLDDEIQKDEQIRLLSVATELPLLDNWRQNLVEPFRDPLPWWLDGTLEAAAKETWEFIEADRTFGAATIRPLPLALAMLTARNQEIAAYSSSVALAASAGEFFGPRAKALLQSTWQIVGDQQVQLRLEVRAEQDAQRQLVVTLIGMKEATNKYQSVEFNYGTAPNRVAPFGLGRASLLLEAREVDDIRSLAVLDVNGNRRHVNLETLPNGT